MLRSSQILLVRHGESEGNAGRPTNDAASALLTIRGERQADAIAGLIERPPGLFVVSSYARSKLTARAALARFPDVSVEEWPVHEFTYLGPTAYCGSTVAERRPAVEAYWKAGDPYQVQGEGAESFAEFLARVRVVRERLESLTAESVVIFSHKKFINALLWSWLAGHPTVSSRRMARYRGFDQAVAFPNGACVSVCLGSEGVRLGPIRTAHLDGIQA